MVMLLLRGMKWEKAPMLNTKREETMEPENQFGSFRLNFAFSISPKTVFARDLD